MVAVVVAAAAVSAGGGAAVSCCTSGPNAIEQENAYPISGRTPGWRYRIDEVSAGVYLLEGRDQQGRSISLTGEDPEALLSKAEAKAAAMLDDT